MQEIELKFQIPDAGLDAVLSAVHHLSNQAPSQHLQAAYFDTPDRRLARARAALRVRQEDENWVQTLKAAATNPMIRLEDNVPTQAVPVGQTIEPDLSLHHGDAATALERDLNWKPGLDPKGRQCGLLQLYRTDIHRHRADLEVQDAQGQSLGWVELALDLGAIHAGTHTMRVQELEIELISGSPRAVIECGRDWIERFGLWLDVQTKAHRGDQLAREFASAQAQPAPPIQSRLPQSDLSAVLQATLEQVSFNMSEVGSPHHLGQLDKAPWQQAWLEGLQHLNDGLQSAGVHQPLNDMVSALADRLSQCSGTDAMLLARSAEASGVCLDLLTLSLGPDTPDN